MPRSTGLRAKGLVYEGTLEPPKGELPDDWETDRDDAVQGDRLRRRQRSPGCASPTADSPISVPISPITRRRPKAPTWLIDIWGADHAGTVKRIKAAVQALTGGTVPFDVKLVQMVRLLRGGEPVKMSKRSGSFVTLADVVREVGKDVVRFTMLTRKADAQMDFDFAKVVEASKDNPVFYVQYAHARGRSLHRRAGEAGDRPGPRARSRPARCRGAGAGQAGRPVPAYRRQRRARA